MELRPAFQIRTVIKALKEVILPAVDPANKLALEQGHLAINQLTLVLHCMPLLYRYDKTELSQFLELGKTLRLQVAALAGSALTGNALAGSSDVLIALEAALASGADVLEKARADPADLEAANFSLREKIGAIVTAVYAQNDSAALQDVSATVLAHAREQLLRERALLISQGWEPDTQSIPAIETLINPA